MRHTNKQCSRRVSCFRGGGRSKAVQTPARRGVARALVDGGQCVSLLGYRANPSPCFNTVANTVATRPCHVTRPSIHCPSFCARPRRLPATQDRCLCHRSQMAKASRTVRPGRGQKHASWSDRWSNTKPGGLFFRCSPGLSKSFSTMRLAGS